MGTVKHETDTTLAHTYTPFYASKAFVTAMKDILFAVVCDCGGSGEGEGFFVRFLTKDYYRTKHSHTDHIQPYTRVSPFMWYDLL